MREQSTAPKRGFSILAMIFVILTVFACAIWANLSFVVTNRANFKYFPPFQAYVNANDNGHVGAEYYCIAQALVAGEGFSSPFREKTGPTAWMPPVLPVILAALLLVGDGSKEVVMAGMIFLQVYALIFTGILVLLLARRTTQRLWALVAAGIFVFAMLNNFHYWFQFTHDCFMVLFAVDVLVFGLCFCRPMDSWWRAGGWGITGGLLALINPIVGMSWGMTTLATAVRERAWRRFVIAALCAALAVSPWIIRNWILFGRFIPVKSNASYELYQSQCLQSDGLLKGGTFGTHPYVSAGRERQEYKALKEMKFLDHKRELFWKAVWADPIDFLDRVAMRFLGTTVWYVPHNREEQARRPWVFWVARLAYPLPFLCFWGLVFTAFWRPPHWSQWCVMGVYVLYLAPYIAVSFYDRYGVPLLGVKVLLVVWGMDRLLWLLPWRKPEIADGAEEAAAPAVKLKTAVRTEAV